MKKPQEITEDDITRSENETTKNVAMVSATSRFALVVPQGHCHVGESHSWNDYCPTLKEP